MDIRSAILEIEDSKDVLKGIARRDWLSSSIPGPRIIIITINNGTYDDLCSIAPYGIYDKKFMQGWEPTFEDLSSTDWFPIKLTKKGSKNNE